MTCLQGMSDQQDSNLYYFFSSATKSSLSNFHQIDLIFDGISYKSSEQAYQHQKALFHNYNKIARDILSSADPRKNLRSGKLIKTDVSWKGRKITIMARILEEKFFQCPEFRAELSESRNKVLVENTPNVDWGIGSNGKGNNKLGVLLMELRHKLLN